MAADQQSHFPFDNSSSRSNSPPPPPCQHGGPNHNISSFMEELENERKMQEAGPSAPLSSFLDEPQYISNPITTNVFVGNLYIRVLKDPGVDENRLLTVFAKYGPVESVKIMWPRSEMEFARGFNNGFVSFSSREDAEQAYANVNKTELDGKIVRLSWGKSVLRGKPLELPKGVRYGGSALTRFEKDQAVLAIDEEKEPVLVQPALDLERRALLDYLADTVHRCGPALEGMVANRERRHYTMGVEVLYPFLIDTKGLDSDDGRYYQWRLYSLAHGDTLNSWRTVDFAMFEAGCRWIPPPCERPINNPKREDLLTMGPPSPSTFKADAKFTETLTILSRLHPPLQESVLLQLLNHLRTISIDRFSVAKAMVFCMDHANHAGPIIGQIMTFLADPETPSSHVTPILYLISDILHNAASPHARSAWAFRSGFNIGLPCIFSAVGVHLKHVEGVMARHKLKGAVSRVLLAWDHWALYSDEFITSLKNSVSLEQVDDEIGGSKTKVFEAQADNTKWENSAKEANADELRNADGDLRAAENDEASEEDIDGEPIDF